MKARLPRRTERHAARRAYREISQQAIISLATVAQERQEVELSRRLCWLTQAQALAVLFDLEIIPDNLSAWCYSIERRGEIVAVQVPIEELVEAIRNQVEEVSYAS